MNGLLRGFKENSLWLSWTFFGALAVLCGLLAIIQSRWIEQIGNAERLRMQTALQNNLSRLSAEFDQSIASACGDMVPPFFNVEREGTEAALAHQYSNWKQTHDRVFRKIAVVQTDNGTPELSLLDLDSGIFAPSQWPDAWRSVRERITDSSGPDKRTDPGQEPTVLAFPLSGSMHGRGGMGREPHFRNPLERQSHLEEDPVHEPPQAPPPMMDGGHQPPQEDWLILDLNPQYIAQVLLPELMAKHLNTAYQAKIVKESNPNITVLSTGTTVSAKEDASVRLLDPIRMERAGARERRGPEPIRFLADSNQLHWRLLVYRSGTSVDDAVFVVRWRNIALSGGILVLMLTMVAALFHYSRRANQLADLQMKFVAGVSHDLRTPLTVIRTAAYNLKGKIANRPEQVEKYGQLIQQESEKLTSLVEQVLRFNAAKAGHVIGERHPIEVETLIDSSLESSLAVPAGRDVTVDRQIEARLPPIFGDQLALKHALQNLFDNAIKYGLEGSNWIGVSACVISEGDKNMLEIRVSDRGPGIPLKEQPKIFDAFVRGQDAVQDHVQGTGLGLNLVQRIAEAHGGSIRLVNGAPQGATFILTLPVASKEISDVTADFAG